MKPTVKMKKHKSFENYRIQASTKTNNRNDDDINN